MSNLADFLALRVGLRKVFLLSEYGRTLASRAVQPSASSPALSRRWEEIPNQGHFSRTDWLSGHRDFCIVCQSRAVILTSLRQGFAVLGSRKPTNISIASWYKGLDQFPVLVSSSLPSTFPELSYGGIGLPYIEETFSRLENF